jgi:hypothetical protein
MSANFKKTILIIVGVLGVILILLFAYEKNVGKKVMDEKNSGSSKMEEKVEVDLSAPTGKTSDILDSAISGIRAEEKLDQSEDELANDSLDDEDEVSAFSNAYEDSKF